MTQITPSPRNRAGVLLAVAGLALAAVAAQPGDAANEPKEPAAGATCFARHVPERKDDLAWENDRIAFRMYGPALEQDVKEHHGSGLDVWAKRSATPIINSWYSSGEYHSDHGTGLDFYEVGTSRGCGGIGVWQDGELHTSNDWVTHKILDLGPDACGFTVTYAPWQIRVGNNTRKVWQTTTITLRKGSNLNKIETTLNSDRPEELIVGVGIAKRPFVGGGKATVNVPGYTGRLLVDTAAGMMSYWQPAERPGTIGCGVLVDPAALVGATQDQENHLLLIKVTPGKPFMYYAGATWTKAINGAPTTPEAWDGYLAGFKRE